MTSVAAEAPPQVFERDYYQRLYEIEERHGWATGMREAMEALLRPAVAGRERLRVLDIGCGTGFLLGHLQRRYSLAGEPVGIDVSPFALQYCRERGASALSLASAVQLPFASNAFDLIICIDTIQHLSPAGADESAVREFARVLRPGGALYLRTNSAVGHTPLVGVDPNQYRRYRLSDLAAMLASAGLTVERATYLNALPGAWAMLRERTRARQQVAAAIGPGLAIHLYPPHLAWLNRVMHSVLAVEAWVLGAWRIDLPFGHSTAVVARRVQQA